MGLRTRIARRFERPLGLPSTAWYDRPDAQRHIEELSDHSPQDRTMLQSWVTNGYAVAEQVVPGAMIDEMLADLDSLFTADTALPGLEFHDLEFDDSGHREKVDHGQLLTRPLAQRQAAKKRSSWRVHAFVEQSSAANKLRCHDELQRIASMILGFETQASYSINFQNGSTQALHQDSMVFHLGVPNLIVGAWIACEDIVEGSGPLVYYPGSHRDPVFEEFDDYPNTNLRTAADDVAARYTGHVTNASTGFEEHRFLARKGDVLFWHGMLIHGGSPITDRRTTRRSLVLHFVPRGADVASTITLPTRW